jgi:hypothetical protein
MPDLLLITDIPAGPRDSPNPMVRWFGRGPEGARCATCRHLVRHRYSRTYWKCALRRNTGGAATDHRVRWSACEKYERGGNEDG